jgi:hypothetical protein
MSKKVFTVCGDFFIYEHYGYQGHPMHKEH